MSVFRRGRAADFASKLIAFLILTAFLPASILNAAPLVWCVAGDDHAAIEISVVESSHRVIEHSHPVDDHAHHGDWHGQDQSHRSADHHSHVCIDFDLMSPALSAANADLDATLLHQLQHSRAKVAQFATGALSDPGPLIRPPPEQHHGTPALAHLRTTKLRL